MPKVKHDCFRRLNSEVRLQEKDIERGYAETVTCIFLDALGAEGGGPAELRLASDHLAGRLWHHGFISRVSLFILVRHPDIHTKLRPSILRFLRG